MVLSQQSLTAWHSEFLGKIRPICKERLVEVAHIAAPSAIHIQVDDAAFLHLLTLHPTACIYSKVDRWAPMEYILDTLTDEEDGIFDDENNPLPEAEYHRLAGLIADKVQKEMADYQAACEGIRGVSFALIDGVTLIDLECSHHTWFEFREKVDDCVERILEISREDEKRARSREKEERKAKIEAVRTQLLEDGYFATLRHLTKRYHHVIGNYADQLPELYETGRLHRERVDQEVLTMVEQVGAILNARAAKGG